MSNCDIYLFVDYGYFKSDKIVVMTDQSFNLGEFCFDSCLKSNSELINLNLNLDLQIDTLIDERFLYNNGIKILLFFISISNMI